MRTPKKILFIVNSLGVGGAEKHLISLVNYLDKHKFILSLAYLKCNEALLAQIDQDQIKDIFCCEVKQRIDYRALHKLANYIKTNRVDMIVCINQYPMLYGLIVRWLSRTNCELIEILHTTEPVSKKERLQQFFYKFIFRYCNKVIFVAHNQMQRWMSLPGFKIKSAHCVYNGIDTQYFSDRFTDDEKKHLRSQIGFSQDHYVVAICAALRPEKNHKDLLTAVNQLKLNGQKVKVLIIGDGSMRKEIESYADEIGMSDDMVITGFKADVRPYIAISDCMVLPTDIETFSVAILEGLAMGKPFVCSNVGGNPEQIEHGVNGFLFKKGDVYKLADYLTMLANPVLRSRVANMARMSVEQKFSFSRMIAEYERIFLGLKSSGNCVLLSPKKHRLVNEELIVRE